MNVVFVRSMDSKTMKPFKVIGIGLNKTGTKTLASCLRQLGYEKHISIRRRDLLIKYKNGQIEDLFEKMEQFESFEDWPFPLMYRELYFRYGDRARYILTKRKDANAWLASLKRHSLRTDPNRHCRLLAYGYNYPHGFEEEHIAFYNQHNKEVIEFFHRHAASHLLLEVSWDAGDRWEGLCSFLGEPVPSTCFPHENSGEAPIAEEIMRENSMRIEQQLEKLRATSATTVA